MDEHVVVAASGTSTCLWRQEGQAHRCGGEADEQEAVAAIGRRIEVEPTAERLRNKRSMQSLLRRSDFRFGIVSICLEFNRSNIELVLASVTDERHPTDLCACKWHL